MKGIGVSKQEEPNRIVFWKAWLVMVMSAFFLGLLVSSRDIKAATPSGDFQVNETFPISENDTKPNFDTWSMLDNQQRRFYGFKGQGSLWVKTASLKSHLFINGKSLSLKKMKAGQWARLNIGDLTRNGQNVIQVNPTGNKMVQIKIPYPTIVNKANVKHNQKRDAFKLIDLLIKAEVDHGFPSAQLAVVHNGELLKQSAYGLTNSYTKSGRHLTHGVKVTNHTLYDLASNTKMFATNFAIQKLVSDNKLKLDTKISQIFPSFKDDPADKIKGKTDMTIRTVLEHQAGFPASYEYYDNNYNPNDPKNLQKNDNSLYTQDRSQILDKIIQTPLSYQPGSKTIYSDIDFMLLGLVIEKITGQRLDQYVKDNLYKPLGLTHTTYLPLQNGFNKNQIAATELDGNLSGGTDNWTNIRTNLIQGEVQDPKAYYNMDGVSGHAGLFSDATDLAKLAQVMINKGGYGNAKLFDEDTLDQFLKPKDTDPSYTLGWRRNAANSYEWAFSDLADPSTVGHSGWTGTITVVDPKNNTTVVLLTNERNTPILKAAGNMDAYEGSHYLVAKYGDIVSLAMSVIAGHSKASNNAKLLSVLQQRYHEIKDNKNDRTLGDKKDLAAIYQVVKWRAKHSSYLTHYLHTKEAKRVADYVK